MTAYHAQNRKVTMGKLKKEVRDLDGLRFMMNMLKEVRQRESGINMEINPIMNMYQARRGDHSGGCVDPPRTRIARSFDGITSTHNVTCIAPSPQQWV